MGLGYVLNDVRPAELICGWAVDEYPVGLKVVKYQSNFFVNFM